MCRSKFEKSVKINNSVLEEFGGFTKNSLKNTLQISNKDNDTELSGFSHSSYVDTDDLGNVLLPHKSNFSVLSLNTQSLNAKFSKLYCILHDLKTQGFEFSAICLQETWFDENCDPSQFDLPDYNLIWQPYSSSAHGGLACYVHKNFKYTVRDTVTKSKIWEAQFIDVHGGNLAKCITIGNVYKPPKDNNNNTNIETFLEEIAPILQKYANKKADSIIVGDFNINLLEINEREKYCDYLELFTSSGFLPRITFPTRFSKKSATLIDQIYCKITENTPSVKSGIIFSQLSDHLPCFLCINVKRSSIHSPKFVKVNTNDKDSLTKFYNHLAGIDFTAKMSQTPTSDPNENYDIFEKELCSAKEKYLPTKVVKFNKYKHRQSDWITTDIIRSIKYRDKLYRKLKETNINNKKYECYKINLKTYSAILNKSIRNAKKQYYSKQFDLYKNDAKKNMGCIERNYS